MDNSKGFSKKTWVSAIIILLLAIFIVIVATLIHNAKPVKVIEENLDGGEIALTYSDDENLFVIENAIPTSDIVGTKLDSAELFFDFTVRTSIEEANNIEYEILLIKDEQISTAIDQNIKVYLEKEKSGTYTEVVKPILFESNVVDKELGNSIMSVYKQKKNISGNDNYRLRLWLSDTAVFDSNIAQNFGVKVVLRGIAK